MLTKNSSSKVTDLSLQVMLGDLPSDFLRLQLPEAQIYDASLLQQELEHNADFLGYFTLTIVEVNLLIHRLPRCHLLLG